MSRDMLCKAANFFVKALQGPFKEARHRKLLLDCDQPVFKFFLYWMCHEHSLPHFTDGLNSDDKETCAQLKTLLLRVWIFAEQ